MKNLRVRETYSQLLRYHGNCWVTVLLVVFLCLFFCLFASFIYLSVVFELYQHRPLIDGYRQESKIGIVVLALHCVRIVLSRRIFEVMFGNALVWSWQQTSAV